MDTTVLYDTRKALQAVLVSARSWSSALRHLFLAFVARRVSCLDKDKLKWLLWLLPSPSASTLRTPIAVSPYG